MEQVKINLEISLSEKTLEALAALFGLLKPETHEEVAAPVMPRPEVRTVAAPAPVPAPDPEPVEAPQPVKASAATLEDVRATIRDARVRIGAAGPIKEVLQKYGADNASSLDASMFDAVINDLKAL